MTVDYFYWINPSVKIRYDLDIPEVHKLTERYKEED